MSKGGNSDNIQDLLDCKKVKVGLINIHGESGLSLAIEKSDIFKKKLVSSAHFCDENEKKCLALCCG